ncbi:hypothetical protein VYJ29_004133 [Yersinia enterocolitica]|nr:hypothetical protein [Yersinia enterocolitica]ELI7961106.1 hypothetical protein [Yersinia enterocolitica]ELI8183253.1 hypothetical protein [Yersinia enterocolitica]ELI8192224.1 hypothetical protein [Yersinia enterocolitica]ELW8935616.1 hypothetical protein [Yersinia enterocolitica]
MGAATTWDRGHSIRPMPRDMAKQGPLLMRASNDKPIKKGSIIPWKTL